MNFTKRLIFWLCGLIILSFGVTLTIKANLGAGAWDALNVGLSNLSGLTVGSFVIVVGILMMLLNAWLLSSRPDFLALFTIFIIGFLIDFWMLVVLSYFEPSDWIGKLLTLGFGLLIIGVGVAVYIQPKFPINPLDNFMLGISKRFKVSLAAAKTIGEILGLILALAVKGPIGIGTIIVMVAIGPSIQLFVPFIEKLAIRLGIKY
jgi:uncharacterized protein